jgi:hypothetical protein
MTKVKGKMTILHFMENRPVSTYKKMVRVLDDTTHKNLGFWADGDTPDKFIKNIKVTKDYIFLFV